MSLRGTSLGFGFDRDLLGGEKLCGTDRKSFVWEPANLVEVFDLDDVSSEEGLQVDLALVGNGPSGAEAFFV